MEPLVKLMNWRIGLLITALLLNGCTAAATQDPICHGQRIMITFASGVDVTRPGFDAGLSRDAGIPVNRMRHLFEDHYLYCAGPEGAASALERLRERPDVRAAEIDRIKHPERKE